MKAETQSRWSHDELKALKTVFFALDLSCSEKKNKGRYKTCKQTLWTMEKRIRRTRPSKSTSVEKTGKDKTDSPIHTGYFHTGEANTLIFIVGRRQFLCHALKNPLKHGRAT